MIDVNGLEDVYFLLGGTWDMNAKQQSVSLDQFKAYTSEAAQSFREKGYSVKYDVLNKSSFSNAVKDKEAKQMFIVSHVRTPDGSVKAMQRGKWISPSDVPNNSDLEITVAGCRMMDLAAKWIGKFKSFFGLHKEQVPADQAVMDLNLSAKATALIMPEKTIPTVPNSGN